MVFRTATFAAIIAAAPAWATGQETVLPISDVIDAFKAEIRNVQGETGFRCSFAITSVDFSFLAQTHVQTKSGVNGKFEVFGIKLGGSAESSENNRHTSRIKLTLVPREAGGMEQVGGSAQVVLGFGDLIRQTKEQIEETAGNDDALMVQEIVIQTGFQIERAQSGKLEVIVTGEAGTGSQDQHEVVLNLGPSVDGGC
ncbi:trypco2 family protein [Microbulbifer sp. S227A]|uniref:trypco2 family protein n=1 Tax=Microbulbifer sp. S227A TaxID=3415131 RepID=UPI003C7A0A52